MSTRSFVSEYLSHFADVMRTEELAEELAAAKDILLDTKERGGKVLLAGNGASAGIASHYALDLTKQAGIRSLAFNDALLITAYGNDYGYDHWVARAIQHHGAGGDVAVLISSSGRSPNVVNAADACRELGIKVLTFTGFEPTNPLRQRGQINFWANSQAYNVVEAVHGLWLGLLCDLIIGKIEYGVTD